MFKLIKRLAPGRANTSREALDVASRDKDYTAFSDEALLIETGFPIRRSKCLPGFNPEMVWNPITYHVVKGIGPVGEWFISFRDRWGGTSATLNDYAQEAFMECKANMIRAALSAGANVIIGFGYNDEIIVSKGRMYKCTTIGTPIRLSDDEFKKLKHFV
jgi:uncharacterized protein YbjQ (UPF0145 family)